MSLLLKLLAVLFTVIAGIAQFLLDHYWHDRRTRKYKRLRLACLGLLVGGALVASSAIISGDQESKKFQSRLMRFVELAERRYPELDPDAALEQLSGRLGLPAVSLRTIDCRFGGLTAPCSLFLDGVSLQVPPQVVGPQGIVAGRQISVELPIQAYEAPDGLALDVTLLDRGGRPLVTVRGDRWEVHDASLLRGVAEDTFEVVGADKVPLFQFHLDRERQLLLIGGKFWSANGDPIWALPDQLWSKDWGLRGLGVSGSVFRADEINLQPDLTKVLGDTETWFDYEQTPPQLRDGAFDEPCTWAKMVSGVCR